MTTTRKHNAHLLAICDCIRNNIRLTDSFFDIQGEGCIHMKSELYAVTMAIHTNRCLRLIVSNFND